MITKRHHLSRLAAIMLLACLTLACSISLGGDEEEAIKPPDLVGTGFFSLETELR